MNMILLGKQNNEVFNAVGHDIKVMLLLGFVS